MSYQHGSIQYATRVDAVSAMIEDFVTAGGFNAGEDSREAITNPEQTVDELLQSGWDLNISTSSENPDIPTREELIGVLSDFNPSDLGIDDEFDDFDDFYR